MTALEDASRGIDKPKFTQIPNVLLDNLEHFDNDELRVLLVAMRNTLGHHRTKHPMSQSFLAKGTGLHASSVRRGINKAKQRGWLTEAGTQESMRGTKIYEIAFYDDFPKEEPVIKKNLNTEGKSSGKGVADEGYNDTDIVHQRQGTMPTDEQGTMSTGEAVLCSPATPRNKEQIKEQKKEVKEREIQSSIQDTVIPPEDMDVAMYSDTDVSGCDFFIIQDGDSEICIDDHELRCPGNIKTNEQSYKEKIHTAGKENPDLFLALEGKRVITRDEERLQLYQNVLPKAVAWYVQEYKPGKKPISWDDMKAAVKDVFRIYNNENHLINMLWGKSTTGQWAKYNMPKDNPVTPDELRAFAGWYKSTTPGAKMVQSPEKIQNYILRFRDEKRRQQQPQLTIVPSGRFTDLVDDNPTLPEIKTPEPKNCADINTPEGQWGAAYRQLKVQLDEQAFLSWIHGAQFIACEGNHFTVKSFNAVSAQMCQGRYYRNIKRVLSDIAGCDVEITFTHDGEKSEKRGATDLKALLAEKLAEQESA